MSARRVHVGVEAHEGARIPVAPPGRLPDNRDERSQREAVPMPDARTPGEESPQATIALLRATLDAVPGWLALVDRDGTYLVANRKYADAFGRPLDRIEGRRWQEIDLAALAWHEQFLGIGT